MNKTSKINPFEISAILIVIVMLILISCQSKKDKANFTEAR